MRLVGQVDVHVPVRFHRLLFPFLGTFLTGVYRDRRMGRHMQCTHGASAQRGWLVEGPRGRGPWQATPGLFNTLLPLQPPKPSDLSIVCFTSGTTGKQRHPGHQPGPPAPLPGSRGGVTAGVSSALWGTAEPCPVPGSRCWVPPAAPSASTGWRDVDGQCVLGGPGVGAGPLGHVILL